MKKRRFVAAFVEEPCPSAWLAKGYLVVLRDSADAARRGGNLSTEEQFRLIERLHGVGGEPILRDLFEGMSKAPSQAERTKLRASS